MSVAEQAWVLLLVGLLAANLPFLTERILIVGPRRSPKPFAWRLLEWLLLTAAVISLGWLIEGRIGQRHPQEWPFYAAVACLMATFAFPGFVWRHLRRGRDRDGGA